MRLKESELDRSIQKQLDENILEEPKEEINEDATIVEEAQGMQQESDSLKQEESEVENPIPLNDVVKEEQPMEETVPTLEEKKEDLPPESVPTLETKEETPTREEEVKEDPVVVEEVTKKPESENPMSHTQVIDGLVREVQMFHDDEDFLPKKKKGRVILMIFIVILLVTVVVAIVLTLPKNEKKSKKEESSTNEETEKEPTYHYSYRDGEIVFFNGEEQMDSYSCVTDSCSLYSLGENSYQEGTIMAIQDGEEVFLYNFLTKEKLTTNLVKLENMMDGDVTKAFVATMKTGEVGVIDPSGNVIIPFEYEELGYSFEKDSLTDYSFEKNAITALKEGAWGVISLDKGTEILPFQYEDIYYNGLDVYVVREDGLWYAVDKTNQKITEQGYDMIIPLPHHLLVAGDGNFTILNNLGEKVIKQDIPTFVVGFRGRSTMEVPTFQVKMEDTTAIIQIMQDEHNPNSYKTYKFDTVKGELTEVIE